MLKNYFFIFSLAATYPLFSLGQIWMYFTKQKENDLYERIQNYAGQWTYSHLVAMAGVLLIIPSALAIGRKLKNKKGEGFITIGTLLVSIGAFSLFGQYIVDFALVDIFSLDKVKAYEILDKIQSNTVIKLVCYDLAAAWFLGMIFILIGLYKSKVMPNWAMIIFGLGLIFLILGPKIHGLVARFAYLLFTISFIPLINNLWVNRIKEGRTSMV